MTERGPFDPGLQPERTELAWRRTALAIAIGSLLSLRVFPFALPSAAEGWGFVPGAAGLIAACILWFAARRRQLRVTAALSGPGEASLPGAGLLVGLLLFSAGFGLLALCLVLLSTIG